MKKVLFEIVVPAVVLALWMITCYSVCCKVEGLSFTLAMVYAVCKCANKIEAFRYRFVDGQVVLYDKIDTAFTYLNKETDLFKVVNVPMIDDL